MGTAANAAPREPWNKGKIVGQKVPFKLKDICDQTHGPGQERSLSPARWMAGQDWTETFGLGRSTDGGHHDRPLSPRVGEWLLDLTFRSLALAGLAGAGE